MFKQPCQRIGAGLLALCLILSSLTTSALAAPSDHFQSRAQFVYSLATIFGLHPVSPDRADFADVTPDNPYYGFVEAAYQKGWVAPGSGFRPADPITRAEVATLLTQALGKGDDAVWWAGSPPTFADDEAIPGWARGSVYTMSREGLMQADAAGRFNPGGYLTASSLRRQIAQVDRYLSTHLVNHTLAVGPAPVLPETTPTIVTVMAGQKFIGDTPLVNKVTLPDGHWAKVILTMSGTIQGRQYDRTLEMWAGNTQIFLGTTPEPVPEGIAWHLQKDITTYLPVLRGTQSFTTLLANYVNATYTGVPTLTVTLAFYPDAASGSVARDPWSIKTPDAIIPVLKDDNRATMAQLGKGQTRSVTVNLPNDLLGAYLDLYAEHQHDDEFYWGNQPAFREIQVAIDGQPAGVVWPYPYVYTGGVNPLLWRPIVGIDTLDIPAYRLNLTPFAGILGGTHTLTITVPNNQGYWNLGGSLLLYENGGKPTKGAVTLNTLKFPDPPKMETTKVFGAADSLLTAEVPQRAYTIQGQIVTDNGTFTATVDAKLDYANDQTNVNTGNWQVVHLGQTVTMAETLVSPDGQTTRRESTETAVLDCTNAFMQPASGKGFFLPASMTQTLDAVHKVTGPDLAVPFQSTQHTSVQGYATMIRQDTTTAMGATAAYSSYRDSLGRSLRQSLSARNGSLVTDQEEDHLDAAAFVAQ